MFLSLLRQAESTSSKLPLTLPITSIPTPPRPHRQTLFQVLSRLPADGVGYGLLQTRWRGKGIRNSYWVVSRVRLRMGGERGKVWGRLVWKGKVVSPKPEEIRGGLKYFWTTQAPRPIGLPKSTEALSGEGAAAAAGVGVRDTATVEGVKA